MKSIRRCSYNSWLTGISVQQEAVMQRRVIGRSDLEVSVVGLGCNNFGRRIDAAATRSVVHAALDVGINFFDTADVYGRGESEEFLGRALGGRRRDVVVATKFAMPMGETDGQCGASGRWIRRAVEDSLRRLGTDYIDLYQQHRFDPETPMSETLDALDELVASGKVRCVGNSNFAAWQVTDAHWRASTKQQTAFVSVQNEYSLLNRDVEGELIPACQALGLGVIPYSPLAGGFLTGKYRRGVTAPTGSRLAEGPSSERWLSDANFDRLDALETVAKTAGRSMLDLSIGWLVAQSHVASVIAGATSAEQVRANADAGTWTLDAAELAQVDLITPPPTPPNRPLRSRST